MKHFGRLILLASLLAGDGAAQGRAPAAGWLENLSLTTSGAVTRVENASRTSAEANRKDATTYELSLGATHRRQLASNWLLQAGADASWLLVSEYDLASHLQAGPRAALQRKFGLGPLAPVLQLDAALAYKAARLEADRGWTTSAGVRIAKRFTPALRGGIAGRWHEHSARRNVFDLVQRSLSIDATWDITDRWSLAGSAGRLSGDIVANASWPVWGMAITGGFGPEVLNYYTSRPWQVTDFYGSGWVSYNVEADVDLWSLAASCAITDHTTAELRYSSAFVVNKIGIRYPTESWGLSLVHRF